MAKKKKKSGGRADAKKAMANIEKAHKELQLHIQKLKTSLEDDGNGAPFFENGDDDKDEKKEKGRGK